LAASHRSAQGGHSRALWAAYDLRQPLQRWCKAGVWDCSLGRSRGGLTTKIHALVDAYGLPILLKLTEGQAHDGRSAEDMLGTVECGDVLLAGRAYDSDALRRNLADRGARANVKPMPNRVNVPRFDKRLYRKRNLVERFFNKLKQFLAVATRYDKR
jgi:transposase